jgi:hypothetical protein
VTLRDVVKKDMSGVCSNRTFDLQFPPNHRLHLNTHHMLSDFRYFFEAKLQLIVTIIGKTYVLFIYSAKACLRGKTPPRLGHLAPASEVTGGLTLPF